MQSVSAAFTAEARDEVRNIAADLLVSWKAESTLGSRTFTIGVSTIGGNDIIGINPGAVGSPGIYRYFDESEYLMSLAWERGLNIPTGGLSKAYAEAELDNTSGRFTPRYMGGTSELFTSILPRRPFIINAGFDIPPEITIPQFAGVFDKTPEVSVRDKMVRVRGADYVDFFQNRFLDQEVMFTGLRTDEVYEDLLQSMGLSTSQYVLDTGINLIPFGLFDKGTRYSNIFHQLAEAENGQFYQDESGIFRFENRQHWDASPYNSVQSIVLTSQVLEAEAPSDDHLINVVEVKSEVLAKQPNQLVFQLAVPIALNASGNTELFVEFDNPILQLQTVTGFEANTLQDQTGTDITDNITIKSVDVFAKAAKIIFYNTTSTPGFLTQLYLYGRPVKKTSDLYVRSADDSSVTAYQERPFVIDNPYIQNESWANSYAQMILNDFSEIENLQKITIRALPQLQLGDLVSWQGRYWRIFDIKTKLDPSVGFVQELTMLQRTITTYFRIGISTIGGTDKIAP